MTESAAVAPEGLTTPQDTDMWNDEQQAVWTRIVEFGHSQGAAMAIHSWPGTGVISPGGPGYQVPFARSVPGGRSQDRRGGDAGWAASG
jgi:2,4-dienoyl-CoA reductase-like NADH-dependent reductase (Old Yellow Enzyme family)